MFGVLSIVLETVGADPLEQVEDYRRCRLAVVVPEGESPRRILFVTINDAGLPDFTEPQYVVEGFMHRFGDSRRERRFSVPYWHDIDYVWVTSDGIFGAKGWTETDQLHLLPASSWSASINTNLGVRGPLYTLDATVGCKY